MLLNFMNFLVSHELSTVKENPVENPLISLKNRESAKFSSSEIELIYSMF